MEKFRLIRPHEGLEGQVLAYAEEFLAHDKTDHIAGGGGLDRYLNDYGGWLNKLAADRQRVSDEERVRAETFCLMKSDAQAGHLLRNDEQIVGMINIRLELNEALWQFGGHIGYGIRPSERHKGYNKMNLYLALNFCMMNELEAVLLDCDKHNIGSAKTMKALGGKLVSRRPLDPKPGETVKERYFIDVARVVADYAPIYAPMVAGSMG